MAKILKFQLLQIKADDQQRREAEQLQVAVAVFLALKITFEVLIIQLMI